MIRLLNHFKIVVFEGGMIYMYWVIIENFQKFICFCYTCRFQNLRYFSLSACIYRFKIFLYICIVSKIAETFCNKNNENNNYVLQLYIKSSKIHEMEHGHVTKSLAFNVSSLLIFDTVKKVVTKIYRNTSNV